MRSCVNRKLVFVHGKGGVGKSTIARAIAQGLSGRGERTLLVSFEDPLREAGELKLLGPQLWSLNADAMLAFEEYASLKIEKIGTLGQGFFSSRIARAFTHNPLIRYLAKAAPGIHELVLLGKVWFERERYDHVIVDMPSTGYGLAMFQSTVNFSKLFGGGPLARDADEMLETFRDPEATGHLIVALPEEMPLREAIELNQFLQDLFPVNPACFLLNRRFPTGPEKESSLSPQNWDSPFASSVGDYISRRRKLEEHNLRLWSNEGISFGEADFLDPSEKDLPGRVSRQLKERELL